MLADGEGVFLVPASLTGTDATRRGPDMNFRCGGGICIIVGLGLAIHAFTLKEEEIIVAPKHSEDLEMLLLGSHGITGRGEVLGRDERNKKKNRDMTREERRKTSEQEVTKERRQTDET